MNVTVPNYERAFVPEAKVAGYLLSDTHPIGRHKAKFFTMFGFLVERWSELATALSLHAANYEAVKVENARYGTRYVVEGIMPTHDGRIPLVRTVWVIDHGADTPRFVSVYPLEAEV